MRRKIITVGGSAGVTISPADLRTLGLAVGDSVEVAVRQGAIEVRPVNHDANLSHDELMAKVDEMFGA